MNKLPAYLHLVSHLSNSPGSSSASCCFPFCSSALLLAAPEEFFLSMSSLSPSGFPSPVSPVRNLVLFLRPLKSLPMSDALSSSSSPLPLSLPLPLESLRLLWRKAFLWMGGVSMFSESMSKVSLRMVIQTSYRPLA